jgi:hypothetical protein
MLIPFPGIKTRLLSEALANTGSKPSTDVAGHSPARFARLNYISLGIIR